MLLLKAASSMFQRPGSIPEHCSLRGQIWLVFFLSVTPVAAESPLEQRFQSSVLPILQANCLACHGDPAPQADLDLRTVDSILAGGKSGPAVLPGSSDRSLLIQKVASGAMPPGDQRLSPAEVELVRQWIDSATPAGQEVASVHLSEKDVLPIFLMRCAVCHGKRKQEGGLDLRTIAGRLKGGKSGPALVPGDPEKSLLFRRILDEEMPPSELLYEYRVRPPTMAEVETLRRWIAAGAASDPPRDAAEDEDPAVAESDRKFWSFQPRKQPAVPEARAKQRIRNPIDSFLLARLEAEKLGFSTEAERHTLLRRAHLDLIGMPPTSDQARAYLDDRQPDAYERMIDGLLASPHYGERWAQHWLDLAGYADTEGIKHADHFRPHAWRYRDYVIRSLNQDKPYDRFLTEQLAGDELADYGNEVTPSVMNLLAATGFLRQVSDPTDSPSNASLAEKMDVVHDEIKVLSSSVMGLTLGCARCHDHKYDPLTQRDYYRLSAILQSSYDPYDWLDPTQRYLKVAPENEKQEVSRFNAPIQAQIDKLEKSFEAKAAPLRQKLQQKNLSALPESIRKDLLQLLTVPEQERSPTQKYLFRRFRDTLEITNQQVSLEDPEFKAQLEKHTTALAELKKELRDEPAVRALFDMGGEPSPVYLLQRGEAGSIGDRVYPGVPAVLRRGLPPFRPASRREGGDTTGNRLALARWLTHQDHPLTARVMVNRIWMHHFGRGIVATPADFGRSGSPPTHPELLDWLANEFVRSGWSIKAMHRLMMTSTAYRQSSLLSQGAEVDPDNLLLSHIPMKRMEAEVLYDAILRVTGRLDPRRFGPADEVEKKPDGEVIAKGSEKGRRRAIYIQRRRFLPMTFLDLFDSPQMAPNCTERRYSTVAPQALQLMHGYMARELSRHLAGRLIDAFPEQPQKQVEELYIRALSRLPTPAEVQVALDSLADLAEKWVGYLEAQRDEAPRRSTAEWSALSSLSHALLSSAEFSYID